MNMTNKPLNLFKQRTNVLAFLVLIVASTASYAERLRGTVSLDGSSTVFPISEAVAEEFLAVQPRVRVTVGVSGTGGGFKKFLNGEIDINDASRTIKEKELTIATERKFEFLELPIAYDGLSVVVNKGNTWVDYLTVSELHEMWKPGSTVKYWSDVRAGWPKKELKLYGPGTDSGTFDYFSETVNGKSGRSRPDFTASEDDNTLVQGIAGDDNSLGYFGYAYYAANKDKLKLVPIDGGNGAVAPSQTTINNGSYAPLSRPIFIYVSKASMMRPEVKTFVNFYVNSAGALASEVGYIPLPDKVYQGALARIASLETGSAYNTLEDAPAFLIAPNLLDLLNE
ncbi:MAG: phosphate transport system substrate-binding protein [Candidatus Azotimanducaceae bacterium]|jgi:phosphate transport system substrate-binding protein